jgi:hypothetical protein
MIKVASRKIKVKYFYKKENVGELMFTLPAY